MKKSTERKLTLAVMILLAVQVIPVTVIVIVNAVHKHRHHRDLLETRAIELRYSGPESVELGEPHAYVRNTELEVSGCLNSSSREIDADMQEVRLSVLSPTGIAVHEIAIEELSRCKLGGAHFKVRLPSIPPKGSILDIRAREKLPDGS